MELRGPEIALGGIDQVGVERQAIQLPRPVGILLDAGANWLPAYSAWAAGSPK